MPGAPRCSRRSRDLGEELRGTASVVTSWLLVEQPGPWGYQALTDSRLPGTLGHDLIARGRAERVRVVLIRRHGRSAPDRRQCYFVHAGRDRRWVEPLVVDAVADLLSLDWSPLARGRPVTGSVGEEPLFLVCTNGARDPCCAERGRGVAAALAPAWDAWECSHIGGDRFAANLVCFPHGIYYGRVVPSTAGRLAAGYRGGLLDLDHYRGRVCYDFGTQAAETFLRERLGLLRIDEVRLASRRRSPTTVEATFTTPAGDVRVVVAVDHAEARPLTCRAVQTVAPPAYHLVALDGPG